MVVVEENVVAARTLLATTLSKSRALASSIHETGSHIQQIHNSILPCNFKPPSSEKHSFMSIKGLIAHVAGLVRVHNMVSQLENTVLSDPSSDTFDYISTVRKLEEALKLLEDSAGLATQWLEGTIELVGGDLCRSDMHESLTILRMLHTTNDRARLPGRCLSVAFHELETRFGLLSGVAYSPSIHELQAILERLGDNGKLENCISIFVEARGWNVRQSLHALGLDYLNQVERIESNNIDKWIEHLRLIVKHVFEPELELCKLVFEKSGSSDVSISCFAEIVFRSGFLPFLLFGDRVARCNSNNSIPDRVKLVKLLDMFGVMNELRLEFNWLFGGGPCGEIRRVTRSLIRGLVNGACEIFLELQARDHKSRYCKYLLGDNKYRPILEQVLAIRRIWKDTDVKALSCVSNC